MARRAPVSRPARVTSAATSRLTDLFGIAHDSLLIKSVPVVLASKLRCALRRCARAQLTARERRAKSELCVFEKCEANVSVVVRGA
jgi:hypothetical protein